MDSGFAHLEKVGGILESDYKYTAKDGTCAESKYKQDRKVKSFVDVKPNSKAMRAQLEKGTLSIGIDASSLVFQFYFGGIIKSTWCGTSLDHGVAIVAYHYNNGTPYWLVKNSWGASWGSHGFLKVAVKEGKGICGVNQQVSQITDLV